MPYDPNTDPIVIDARKRVAQAEIDAKAKADAMMSDHNLGRVKGKTPEQIEARKRVAALFCQWHLPNESPEAIKARLDKIDYTQTVTSTNARGKELEASEGFLGMGKKPAYLVSQQYVPQSDAAPIYALEYFPLKQQH